MIIPCGIWRHPNGVPAQIKVRTYFSCFNLSVSDFILPLIDTGAVSCLLAESDAIRLGIKYSELQLLPEELWATGVGGVSPLYRMNHECKLTFRTGRPTDEKRGFHVETFDHFDVLKVEIADEKTRKKVMSNIPSLLGMDLLCKFRFVATDKEAYLER